MKNTGTDYKKVIDLAISLGAKKSSREGFVVVAGKQIDLTACDYTVEAVAKNILRQLPNDTQLKQETKNSYDD